MKYIALVSLLFLSLVFNSHQSFAAANRTPAQHKRHIPDALINSALAELIRYDAATQPFDRRIVGKKLDDLITMMERASADSYGLLKDGVAKFKKAVQHLGEPNTSGYRERIYYCYTLVGDLLVLESRTNDVEERRTRISQAILHQEDGQQLEQRPRTKTEPEPETPQESTQSAGDIYPIDTYTLRDALTTEQIEDYYRHEARDLAEAIAGIGVFNSSTSESNLAIQSAEARVLTQPVITQRTWATLLHSKYLNLMRFGALVGGAALTYSVGVHGSLELGEAVGVAAGSIATGGLTYITNRFVTGESSLFWAQGKGRETYFALVKSELELLGVQTPEAVTMEWIHSVIESGLTVANAMADPFLFRGLFIDTASTLMKLKLEIMNSNGRNRMQLEPLIDSILNNLGEPFQATRFTRSTGSRFNPMHRLYRSRLASWANSKQNILLGALRAIRELSAHSSEYGLTSSQIEDLAKIFNSALPVPQEGRSADHLHQETELLEQDHIQIDGVNPANPSFAEEILKLRKGMFSEVSRQTIGLLESTGRRIEIRGTIEQTTRYHNVDASELRLQIRILDINGNRDAIIENLRPIPFSSIGSSVHNLNGFVDQVRLAIDRFAIAQLPAEAQMAHCSELLAGKMPIRARVELNTNDDAEEFLIQQSQTRSRGRRD